MIIKSNSYKTSDGALHPTIEAAQVHALQSLMAEVAPFSMTESALSVAEHLVKNKSAIVDLLTTKPSSRPKARKVNRKCKLENTSQPGGETGLK